MRPDDRSVRWQPVDGMGGGVDDGFDGYGPLDADLEALDAELDDAGAQGRRMLRGQTQPTRFFANRLRDRLLAVYAVPAPVAAGTGAAPAIPSSQPRRTGVRPALTEPGESWAPIALQPQIARR